MRTALSPCLSLNSASNYWHQRLYSQKQIFELARNPSALLDIIDEAPEVGYTAYKEKERNLENQYKQIEQKIQELDQKIYQENQLLGESNDLARQIKQIEESDHRDVLRNYRKRQQQESEIKRLENEWEAISKKLDEMRVEVAPAHFEAQRFEEHDDMLSAVRETNEKWGNVANRLKYLIQEAKKIVADWHAEKDSAAWMRALKADKAQYEQVRTQFEEKNIDPNKYPLHLERHSDLQRELQRISEYRTSAHKLRDKKESVFEKIVENREDLSAKRQEFLTCVLKGNSSVSIEVRPFGEDWGSIEKEIRAILQCPERFDSDFSNLKAVYLNSGGQQIENLKRTIEHIRSGLDNSGTGWFTGRLKKLKPETIRDLKLWFPADDLKITFGLNNQPIEQGSPGQKTAALLAFILSYGSEPLLLDQPEDDLDNELIYDLIVQQLRETKSRRQIIVVTHNANIVVNGDAEMVLPLKVAGGETHVQNPASIQNKKVRQEICAILEGGRKAFEQRYRRIHLES